MVAVPSMGRANQVTPRRAAPEADATRELYERYARQIFAYCLHQLRNKEEAEDAMQSTFLNAFRGLRRGVDPEFESAWLYKIAQNVCLTRQRSTTRRRRVETPGDLDALQDVLPAPAAESDQLIGLPEALGGLPEQQRRALLLREWQGLSYKEIAEELDLSQAAVETLLFRARRSLAAGLTEHPPGKRVLGKARAGGDAGSLLALLQGLFFSGGAKVAVTVTVATVAASSVVAATPQARDAVVHAVGFAPMQRVVAHAPGAKPKPAVVGGASSRPRGGAAPAAHTPRAVAPKRATRIPAHRPVGNLPTLQARRAAQARVVTLDPAVAAPQTAPAVAPAAPAPVSPVQPASMPEPAPTVTVEEPSAPPVPDQPNPKAQDEPQGGAAPSGRSVAGAPAQHEAKDAKRGEHGNRAGHKDNTSPQPLAPAVAPPQTVVPPQPVAAADSTAVDPTTTTVPDTSATPAAVTAPTPDAGAQNHGNGGSDRPRRDQGDRGSGKGK